jgi:hypothetical protein
LKGKEKNLKTWKKKVTRRKEKGVRLRNKGEEKHRRNLK